MAATLRATALSERLDLRDNSLNALRLLFAGLVVVYHAWPLSGRPAPRLGDMPLGTLAVAGFFAISGYLITGSRARQRLLPYLTARVARIMPGFWIALLVVAFVFAPLGYLVGGGAWHVADATSYIGRNALLEIRQVGIGTTLRGAPYPRGWDGSLWSLVHEFRCYLIVAVLFCLPVVRRNPKPALVAAFFVTSAYGVLDRGGVTASHAVLLHSDTPTVLAFFFAGALLWAFREWVPSSLWLALACVAAVTVLSATWLGMLFAPLPLAYVVLEAGHRLPRWTRRINTPNDYSYGLYIYAFPVMQLLAMLGVGRAGGAVLALATFAGTVPFMVGSWWLVERPAQRMARRIVRSRSQIGMPQPRHGVSVQYTVT